MQITLSGAKLPEMPRRRYTEEEKAEALDLWQNRGPSVAAHLTGISEGTLSSWASRAGMQSSAREQMASALEAKRQRWEDTRLEMIHEMGEVAVKALHVADEKLDEGKTGPAQQAATTMAILVDKAQLLAGGVTSRTETLTGSAIDAEVQRLSAELDLVASGQS